MVRVVLVMVVVVRVMILVIVKVEVRWVVTCFYYFLLKPISGLG